MVTDEKPISTSRSKQQRWRAAATLLVEAKLKSIPSQEQLDRYFEKTTQKKILDLPRLDPSGSEACQAESRAQVEISPASARHVLLANCEDIFQHWEVICWSRIVRAIRDGLNDMSGPEADRLRYLLQDYTDGVETMLDLVTAERKIAEEAGLAWGDIQRRWERYKEVRLHDLVSKYSVSALLPKLRSAAFSRVPSTENMKQRADVIYNNGTVGVHLELSVPFGRSTPRDKSAEMPRLCIGVQIEGSDYRHFLILRNGAKSAVDEEFRQIMEAVHERWFLHNGMIGKKRISAEDVFSSLKTYRIPQEIMKYSSRKVPKLVFSEICDDLATSFHIAAGVLLTVMARGSEAGQESGEPERSDLDQGTTTLVA